MSRPPYVKVQKENKVSIPSYIFRALGRPKRGYTTVQEDGFTLHKNECEGSTPVLIYCANVSGRFAIPVGCYRHLDKVDGFNVEFRPDRSVKYIYAVMQKVNLNKEVNP